METTLILKVQTGVNGSGNATYANRSFADINPEITNANLYTIGSKLASLQIYTLNKISRTDVTELTGE